MTTKIDLFDKSEFDSRSNVPGETVTNTDLLVRVCPRLLAAKSEFV